MNNKISIDEKKKKEILFYDLNKYFYSLNNNNNDFRNNLKIYNPGSSPNGLLEKKFSQIQNLSIIHFFPKNSWNQLR